MTNSVKLERARNLAVIAADRVRYLGSHIGEVSHKSAPIIAPADISSSGDLTELVDIIMACLDMAITMHEDAVRSGDTLEPCAHFFPET